MSETTQSLEPQFDAEPAPTAREPVPPPFTFAPERMTVALHPLESLRRDHRALLQLTDALDTYRALLVAGGRAQPRVLRALTLALRSVGDYRHFEKEEQVLEQVLVRNGYNWNLQSLIHARATHRQLRHSLDVLEHAAQRASRWSQPDRWAIAETLLDFSRRQRTLASLQERELFPEILRRLDPMALAELAARLERFDSQCEAWAPSLDIGRLCRDVERRCAARPAAPLGTPTGAARGYERAVS